MKGISFTGLKPGKLVEAKDSLLIMTEKTACNTVILVIGALQDTAHSEYVDYKHAFIPTDDDVYEFIEYMKSMGLRVILKPFVNCKDGTWRAYINFFDEDVISEPKWSKWFEYYSDFQLHYAKIAEDTGCEMLIIGCEMVQAQKKEFEWRLLIDQIRMVYHGLITYNTDKYQEDRVTWWDAVDVISSSGYYPIDEWNRQLDRIEAAIKPYKKPFFFAEVGCKSCIGSSRLPSDWTMQGNIALEEQAEYYRIMFDECKKRKFVKGFGIWNWHSALYKEKDGPKDRGYELFAKPACDIIYKEWNEKD